MCLPVSAAIGCRGGAAGSGNSKVRGKKIMCNLGSGDLPKFFECYHPVARKEHICCECGSIILKGEKYESFTGLWDEFETYKTCSFCSTVRSMATGDFDLNSDEGFPFGELWECVGTDYAAS